MDFFTSTDLQRFASHAGQPYTSTNPSHQRTKDLILDGPVRKTTHWGQLMLPMIRQLGYALTIHNQAHDVDRTTNTPIFRAYTWASFAKPTAAAGNVYFTVGVNRSGNFLVKLDFQRYDQPQREVSQNLSADERNILGEFITAHLGEEAAGVEIKKANLGRYTWATLTAWAVEFIRKYDALYNEAARAIGVGGLPPAWGGSPPSAENLARRRNSYFIEAKEIDPADDHYKMSVELHRQLQQLCGAENVAVESSTGYRTRMDLEVRNPANDERILFELKSGEGPTALRPAIREALGQLLEYAYWPDKPAAVKALVIATPNEPTAEARQFLTRIVLPHDAKVVYLRVRPGIGADIEQLRRLLRRFSFLP